MDIVKIRERILFNQRILQKAEQGKFEQISLGMFRSAFQVEKSIHLKLHHSNGYVLGLKHAEVFDESEAQRLIRANESAILHKYTSEEMNEILHTPYTIEDYVEWVKIHLN